MNIYVITPCGGSIEDLDLTINRLKKISMQVKYLNFIHIVVLNNGVISNKLRSQSIGNYRLIVKDINPIASRAKARNFALTQISNKCEGYVCFLDSGDYFVSNAFENFSDLVDVSIDLYSFDSIVKGKDICSIRKPLSLKLINFVNPFYLGSILLSTKIACRLEFKEGRKEDWKYWKEVVLRKPSIKRVRKILYVYTVKSLANHISRKSHLVKDQYLFFRQYLGYPIYESMFRLSIHYLILSFMWFFYYQNKKIEFSET